MKRISMTYGQVLFELGIKVELPEKIVNIANCKNPRCITSVEQEIDHVFKLTDREHQVYRCIYCESKLKK